MSGGFGFSRMGFAPFGTGDIITAPAPSSENLLDAKGVQQSARAIDAATGQYILNADGSFQGMPHVEQLVLLAIRAMPPIGGDAGPLANNRILKQLQVTLADLVSQGLIAILGLGAVAVTPTQVRAGLRWRDLTTQQERTTPL